MPMPTEEMTRLIGALRKRPRRELSPRVRLYLAAYDGRGVHLSADDVAELTSDEGLMVAAGYEFEALGLDADTVNWLMARS